VVAPIAVEDVLNNFFPAVTFDVEVDVWRPIAFSNNKPSDTASALVMPRA
jgi:hypothetical protein